MANIIKLALPVLVAMAMVSMLESASVGQPQVRLLDVNGKDLEIGRIVAEETTVGQLKKILSYFLKTKISEIRLVTGNAVNMNEDEKLLATYASPEKDLIVRIQEPINKPGNIQVEIPKRMIQINLGRDRTLNSLLNHITTEIAMTRNQIVLNGRKLTNSSKSLDEYKFYNGAHVIMVPEDELYTMVVRKTNGDFVEFDMTLETTVSQLKGMIEGRENLVMEGKGLLHYETILDDNAKVFSYSKAPRQGLVVEIVDLLLPDRPTKIELFYDFGGANKKRSSFEVTATNNVGTLREFATRMVTNSYPDELALEFQGKLLEDNLVKLIDLSFYENSKIKILRKNLRL